MSHSTVQPPRSDDSRAVLPITCYIRTKNEQRRIGQVIEAAQQICDEVICVDSGSTDATCEIAGQLGARIVAQPWLGNGHQKRVGEQASRNDWVLDLDADEVLSPALITSLRTLFAAGEPTETVYRLALTTVDPTGFVWEGIGVAMRAKLYRKSHWSMPDHGAWDQLQLPAGTEVGRIDAPLLHYAFTDIGHLTVKQNQAMTRRVASLPPRPLGRLKARIFLGLPCFFAKKYFLQGLWKAGTYGFAMAVACAYARWLRDVKDFERQVVPDPADASTSDRSTGTQTASIRASAAEAA